MSTTISPIRSSEQKYTYHLAAKRPSALSRFLKWAESEDEERHLGWLGITVTSMSTIFCPLAMAIILMNGGAFALIIVVLVALALVVVSNLAALPTKYTIPFFFLGVLMDIAAMGLTFVVHGGY